MSDSSSGKFEFSCPSCLRPIKAGLRTAGKTLPCPGCGKMITVPIPEEAQWNAVHKPPSEDEYALADEPTEGQRYTSPIAPGYEDNYYESELDGNTYRDPVDRASDQDFEDDEEIVIIERPKLPPHPMVTGIFSMFADPAAIFWYVILTFLISIEVGLLTIPAILFAGLVQDINWGTAGTFMMGAVNTALGSAFGLAILLFASNCFLSILQDSAAGNRTIEAWPNKSGGSFNVAGMLFVAGALLYGIGIAWVISWFLGNQNLVWFSAGLIVCFFTFPFFLMSSLETDSPLIPFSINVFRSFFARFKTWFVFYVETGILYGITIGTAILIIETIGNRPKALSTAFALILGPLLTFFLFLYFRLMGRLTWVCDEWFRSLEPEEDEDEEEDGDDDWEER